MEELLDNPYFWSGISLVAVALLGVRYGKNAIVKFLDGEIAKIRADLDQAQALRTEAEAALASCKQKQQEAGQAAAEILAQANREAERLRAAAGRELQERLARHELQAKERIERAEAEALAQVRAAAVDLALKAGAEVLRDRFATANTANDYLDQALANLPHQLAHKVA